MKTNTKVNIIFGLAIITGVSVGWLFLSSEEMISVTPTDNYQVQKVTRVETEVETETSTKTHD